jgi:hypothetical protein
MSSSLYLLFEPAAGLEVTLPPLVQDLAVPGYSFSSHRLKPVMQVPGEPDVPTRCQFYAQNDFRIFIADPAIQFHRESALPSELANGGQRFQSAVLGLRQFTLRRWIITEEDWDDDDQPVVRILSEGNTRAGLDAAGAER